MILDNLSSRSKTWNAAKTSALMLVAAAAFLLAPAAQAEALPEMLAQQQKTTTRQNRTVIVPAADPRQTPINTEGLEGIIGGIKSSRAPVQLPPPGQVQQSVPQQPQQQQPRPTGPVITQVQPSAAGVNLLFSNAPLTTVIDVIMKELGYSYMVDPGVNGTVNIQTSKPIKREDLFSTLELILKLNNAAVVKSGDIYLIVPIAEGIKTPHEILLDLKKKTEVVTPPPKPASGTTPPPSSAASAPAEPRVLSVQGPTSLGDEKGLVTVIIPLEFIPTSEMNPIIQQFMSGGATLLSYDPKNILIVTDFKPNIEKVKKIIELLDSRLFDINTTELIPVRYNRAADVAKDLNAVFGAGSDSSGVNLIPIERLNSILVIAHSQHVLDEVHKWLEKLDSPSSGMNVQTFVYQVENSTAGNIADILSQLYSDGSGLPSAATAEGQLQQQQYPQQQRPSSIRPQESMGARRGLTSSLAPNLEGRPISQRSQAGGGSLLGGNVKIIVNEFNNSLIIQSTEADYQYIERTIKQLDVLPRQVLIEAKVYSVELRDELSFGIAAFLEQRQQALATTASVGDKKTPSGALNAATRFIIGESREIEATLNALRTKTNVRILEAPRLLALDGQQANINIGADVPVTTSSFGDPAISGNPAAFLNQIQFRPTGTTLVLNPRISASGMVTMDLSIEVSSAVGSTLTPTINRNYVETSLVVRDGHTIAIGGIISDSDTLDRSRVPLLGDLPILGALFGTTEKKHRRSELIILITPHVVGSVPQSDSVSSEFRRALKRAYDFVNDKEQSQDKRIEERTRKEIIDEQKRQEKLLKKKLK
ncbi:MAG TPA: secretin N-terminal domain-containing protein [Acidobacteriota bacterium]